MENRDIAVEFGFYAVEKYRFAVEIGSFAVGIDLKTDDFRGVAVEMDASAVGKGLGALEKEDSAVA